MSEFCWTWVIEMLSHSLVILSIHLQFSLSKTKTRSSHSDREQRKTWPGPVTFGASWLVEARCVSFVAVWTARQAALWALPWTQSYLSSPVRADLYRRLKADSLWFLWHILWLDERTSQYKAAHIIFKDAEMIHWPTDYVGPFHWAFIDWKRLIFRP